MTSTNALQPTILMVDDEPQLLHSADFILRAAGLKNISTTEDSRRVIPLIEQKAVDLIILDLTMPHLSGQDLLERIVTEHPEIPVIIMTASGDLDTAIDCMRLGAMDYLVKPVEKNRFISAVRRALEIHSLRNELYSLKQHLLSDTLEHPQAFAEIITNSSKMHSIFQYIEATAPSHHPLLISGETGTGKELIARAAHRLSGREGSFVAENIAGLDENVFTDTLFGHKKGAFTGAEQARDGLVAKAADGTLFLDEIGDLDSSSQIKLLRLLQEHKYYPLGSDYPQDSSARIIVATNQNIAQLVNEGRFRKDLYFRLRTHHLHLPPLRERKEDLPLLTNHFLEQATAALGKSSLRPPAELYSLLKNYSFPGNIRELEAMIIDAVAVHRGGTLSLASFKSSIRLNLENDIPADHARNEASEAAVCFGERLPTLRNVEWSLINEALARADQNQGIAAAMLGISRQALNQRLLRSKDK